MNKYGIFKLLAYIKEKIFIKHNNYRNLKEKEKTTVVEAAKEVMADAKKNIVNTEKIVVKKTIREAEETEVVDELMDEAESGSSSTVTERTTIENVTEDEKLMEQDVSFKPVDDTMEEIAVGIVDEIVEKEVSGTAGEMKKDIPTETIIETAREKVAEVIDELENSVDMKDTVSEIGTEKKTEMDDEAKLINTKDAYENKNVSFQEKPQDIYVGIAAMEKNASERKKELTRIEKELLYNDNVEVALMTVNPKYSSLLNEIPEIDTFSKLYNRIVREFKNVKLLCEIEINDAEYRLLCKYFRKKYLQIRRDIGKSVVDIIFSVSLVQIGMKNYDGNFWKHIDDVLGIKMPVSHRVWIGGTLSDTLVAFGKPLFGNQEYVTNILMHCFVSQPFLAKMYDYLFQYYNLDLQRDMAGLNADDLDFLCASIKNPFGMRKQLLSNYTALSMKANETYCKGIVYKALQLIDMSFWNEYSMEITFPERFQKEFEEWKNNSNFYKNEQKRMEDVLLSGSRTKVYRKPHLKCNFEKNIFEAILPSQMVRESNENVFPELQWKIVSVKTMRELKCNLEEGYSGYKTKELRLELEPEETFGEIQFFLYKDNEVIRKFSWNKHKINFFNEAGNWIYGNSLESGICFGYAEMDTEVISDALLSVSVRNKMRFFEFNLSAGDIIQVLNEHNYYVGEVPNVGLTRESMHKGIHIFDTQEEKVQVYSKLPAYVVDIPINQFNGTAIYVNGKIERMSEKDFIDVCPAKNDEKKFYFLNLSMLENIQIGINEIIIDIPGSARNLREKFAYIPDFYYSFEDAPYVFQKRGTFSVNRKIENGIITDVKCKDMQSFNFEIEDSNNGCLTFSILLGEKKYRMDIIIPVFMYSWDMSNWHTSKGKDVWHTELKSYMYIKFPAEQISLVVNGKKDIAQAAYVFSKNTKGIFACDLTKLKSYFNDGNVIKKVKLVSDSMEYDILNIVTRSYLNNVVLEVDYETEEAIWKFDIIGKNKYYADIFYKEECILEKEPIIEGKIDMKMSVHSAEYLVKVFENEDEFGFDEEYEIVGESKTTVLNPMELTNSCMKLNLISEIDNPENKLEMAYNYYVFISDVDESMEDNRHYYVGILVGLFHNSVICASKVKVYIPNLNNINQVNVSFVDEYDDDCEFLYDTYTNSISEYENSRCTKSEAYRRYDMLYMDVFVWNVNYVANDQVLYKKAVMWLESHKTRNNSSVWKSGKNGFTNNSISEMGLSIRSYNCLLRAGLFTVGQVLEAYQKGNLVKVRNLGQKNYEEVYSKLCERNLI